MKIKKETLQTKVQYFVLFFFPFSVVFFNPSKEFLGFLSITDLFVGLSLILFLIYMSIKKVYLPSRFLMLIVLILFSFLSLIINEELQFLSKIKYQIRWIFYLFAFIIIYNLSDRRSINYFKNGLFLATSFVCIYAVLQVLFKSVMIPTIFWIHTFPSYIEITFRAVGTFDNPLNLCGFLVFPLGILQYTSEKSTKEKYLNLLIYLALVATASKIAFLVILISLLIYFKKYIKFLVYGTLALFVAIIVFFSIAKESLNENYIYKRISDKRLMDGSVDTRLYMFGSALEILGNNPIFGIGYENFQENYLKLEDRNTKLKINKTNYTAENFFVDFYLDNGLVPFVILFLIILEVIIFYFYKVNFSMQFSFSIILFLIIGLVMSARTVPLLYMLFTYIAIIHKDLKITNEEATINYYS